MITNLNTKHLINFIDGYVPIEKTHIFKHLKISKPAAEIMRYAMRKYIRENVAGFTIGHLLSTICYENDIMPVQISSKKLQERSNREIIEDIQEYTDEKGKRKKEKVMIDITDTFKEVDILNNEFYEYLDNIKYVEELMKTGWLSYQKDYKGIQDLDSEVYIDEDFFELIEHGSLKISKIEYNDVGYQTYLEYLTDYFKLIDILIKYKIVFNMIDKTSPKMLKLEQELTSIKKHISVRMEKTTIHIPLESYIKNHDYTEKHKLVLLALLKAEFDKEEENDEDTFREEENLLSLFYDTKPKLLPLNPFMFKSAEDVLYFSEIYNPINYNMVRYYFLTDETLEELKYSNEDMHERISNFTGYIKQSKIFEILKNDTELNDIVLNNNTLNLVNTLIKQLDPAIQDKLIKWGIQKHKSIEAKIVFSGPSGTGKTATAIAIAQAVGKEILSFDCSKVLDMYIGNSEKNTRQIFDEYNTIVAKTGIKPILLLNEADQLFGKRESGGTTGTHTNNQVISILLEQLEQFEGILIITTNLIENIDKAFSRRFNYKIIFEKPDFNQRREIWQKHFPKNVEISKDVDLDKLAKYELTGGQISLIVKNTAKEVACREEELFVLEDFIKQIDIEIKGSFDTADSKTMGFLK